MKQTWFNKFEIFFEWALVFCTSLMVLVVILQIFARYVLPWSPHWTEEVARFSFIYMVSIGAGLALKDNLYVNVTTFLDRFSPQKRIYMESVILCFIIALMLVMFVSSFPLINIVKIQISAALQINMALIYFSMMLLSFLVMLYAGLKLKEKLKLL